MISIGFEAPNILAAIVNCQKEGEWEACVSILKNQKFTFNPEKKVWIKPAVLYNENLYDTLRIVTDVYFPDPIKELIKNYPSTLKSELIVEKAHNFDYADLIKAPYKPIVGKSPFENFQDEDIRRAVGQNRFLFNWTMGCGKSFATAVIYEYLQMYKGVQKMLLLTSRIGTYNLKNEMNKFCLHCNEDDIQVFNSVKSFKKSGRTVFEDEDVCNKKILVFSYDSWKLVSKAYGDKPRARNLCIPVDNFFKGTERLICLDECHYLSNPKSDRSKSIFKYLKLFKYRYLFSATPADKQEKLYSILLMLDPKLCRYLKYTDWINKYNDVGTWFSKYAINKNGWHEDELKALNRELEVYSAKRSSEVLDLPPLSVHTYEVDMSEKLDKLYKEVTNDIVNNCIKKNPDLSSASVDIIKEAFSTVMSLCENPNILATSATDLVSDKYKEKCGKYNYGTDYAKLDVVDAILEDEIEAGNRGIVWYVHPKTKDVIIDRYASYKPVVIDAELSEEDRDKLLAEFKTNSEHKILIASQNILATSVTLIECSFAIYLETAFAYETYYQSTGRIYRIGQKQKVRIYHIWLNKSTDLFHINAIEKKSDLVNLLFSRQKPILNKEQMRDLFTGQLSVN